MLNPVSPKMQGIPKGFEQYKQFINWKLVPDGTGWKKLPCNRSGYVIDAHEPANWLSAEEACDSEYGIAFVFTHHDPFWFIDLDAALVDGQWSPFAIWACEFFKGCAIEVSHSGNGLHLFGWGSHKLPADHGCKNTGLGVELYTSGRFVALTGSGAAGNAWTDYSDRLARFVVECKLGSREAVLDDVGGDTPDIRYTGPDDDDEVVRMMCGSTGGLKAMFGAKIHPRDLWECNREALTAAWPVTTKRGDGATWDWSNADASLMWHLAFWVGRDRSRMVRLFERSKLYRPDKYEGKGAYRVPLVLKQGMRNPNVYDRPRGGLAVQPVAPGAVAPSERGGRSQMQLAEQIGHFAGCVYVQAAHAVMVPDGRLLRPAVFNAVYGGHSFQMQYDQGKPTHEAFVTFTENRIHRFPTAIDVCFRPDRAPGEMVDGMINTWVPAVVESVPGDVTRFLNHIALMIPNPNDRAIILTYMQSLARNPGRKFQWAPVVQGMEGNGKSLLIRALVRAISRKYSHIPKASQLTEKFNGWIEGRLFIGVEEIKVIEKREVLEDLKESATNDWVEIRGMQREKRMVDNYTNWIFCTNHKDAIPINRDQRRYCIFYTAQQSLDDLKRDGMTEEYFVSLYKWLNDEGGYAAVTHWLKTSPLVDARYNPADTCQRAPATSSTEEAVSVSLGVVEQEILEAVDEGVPGFRDDWVSSWAITALFERKGVRKLATRKKGEILKSLGYEKIMRTPKTIFEEGNNQPYLYRRNGKQGSLNEYLISQGYHTTLKGAFPTLG